MSMSHVAAAVVATWRKLDSARARARFVLFFLVLVVQNLGLENVWLGVRLLVQYYIVLPWSGLLHKGVSYAAEIVSDDICSDEEEDAKDSDAARPHDRQVLDIYLPHREPCRCDRRKVVVFVHGGAWGSGNTWQYALLGRFFALQHDILALVVTYRIFPDGSVVDQICDVRAALIWARKNVATFGGDPDSIYVFAHSAGAHLVSMALLGDLGKVFPAKMASLLELNLKAVVLAAGVYDIEHHYQYEAWRGVSEISTMKPAMGGPGNFDLLSPTHLARVLTRDALSNVLLPSQRSFAEPLQLHGDTIASVLVGAHEHLDSEQRRPCHDENSSRSFPPLYLMTSGADSTVPFHASVAFYHSSARVGLPVRLLLYDGVAHADFVTDYMENCPERDHRCHFYAPVAKQHLELSKGHEKKHQEGQINRTCADLRHMHPKHVEDLLYILS
ncbi:putative isoprenylcysteine alpha-carbonyl methylesterase ICME [Porphyridium purpureum]|uniref:Putative isoprenylcysteine alpha-carbonyl methylesterase ICME n=1 Tax=Porphyridium purpureum TaxID=35688 RepID=A0A5J4Z1W1_PORPP|nr:putative isoprenylcysteine alpha-carbonyl methylesterase ICME [Porphyridium purpureum]|eukprot:POR5624..scf208_2